MSEYSKNCEMVDYLNDTIEKNKDAKLDRILIIGNPIHETITDIHETITDIHETITDIHETKQEPNTPHIQKIHNNSQTFAKLIIQDQENEKNICLKKIQTTSLKHLMQSGNYDISNQHKIKNRSVAFNTSVLGLKDDRTHPNILSGSLGLRNNSKMPWNDSSKRPVEPWHESQSVESPYLLLNLQVTTSDKVSNSVEKKIVFLNFENETFKPVLKIDDDILSIIKEWYEINDIVCDVETTNINIDNDITENDLTKILYKTINYDKKDIFINKYIPNVLENIKHQQMLEKLEIDVFDKNNIEKLTNLNNIKKCEMINTTIPENMQLSEPYFYMKNGKKTVYDENNQQIHRIIPITITKKEADVKEYSNVKEQNSMIDDNEMSEHMKLFGTLPYNFYYNIFKPFFSDSAMSLEEPKETKKDEPTLIIVLIQPTFMKTFVITNPSLDELKAITKYEEYGFVKLFALTSHSNEVIKMIKMAFNFVSFNNVDSIDIMLSGISHFIDDVKNNPVKQTDNAREETNVIQYLKTNFEMSNDINNKMKATELFNIIIEANVCNIEKNNINGFKNRLSQYFKAIGLRKKRYNDGYYYYGIVLKKTQQQQQHWFDNSFDFSEIYKNNKTLETLMEEHINTRQWLDNSLKLPKNNKTLETLMGEHINTRQLVDNSLEFPKNI